MSMTLMSIAMRTECPSPLAKLLLIFICDNNNEDGALRVDFVEASDFCGAKFDETKSAFAELRLADIIEKRGDGYWLAGFVPHVPDKRPRERQVRKAIRNLVYDRDGRICAECGREHDLSIDHIIPQSRGGSDHPDNLQVLCRPCNASKGARI